MSAYIHPVMHSGSGTDIPHVVAERDWRQQLREVQMIVEAVLSDMNGCKRSGMVGMVGGTSDMGDMNGKGSGMVGKVGGMNDDYGDNGFERGIVKRWIEERGFGFIEVDGKTCFFHASSIRRRGRVLIGARVVVKAILDPCHGDEKMKAVEVWLEADFDALRRGAPPGLSGDEDRLEGDVRQGLQREGPSRTSKRR